MIINLYPENSLELLAKIIYCYGLCSLSEQGERHVKTVIYRLVILFGKSGLLVLASKLQTVFGQRHSQEVSVISH